MHLIVKRQARVTRPTGLRDRGRKQGLRGRGRVTQRWSEMILSRGLRKTSDFIPENRSQDWAAPRKHTVGKFLIEVNTQTP